MTMNDHQSAARRAALEREREGYVARGLSDRAAAVDAELERLGAGERTKQPPGRQTRPRGAGAQKRGR